MLIELDRVYTGVVDMIKRMFPLFPTPGFVPNFTAYDTHWNEIDWYEMYGFMAQAPRASVMWVSRPNYQLRYA